MTAAGILPSGLHGRGLLWGWWKKSKKSKAKRGDVKVDVKAGMVDVKAGKV